MTTDTQVTNLIINKLTKTQYEGIANPSDTELYLTPDESVTQDELTSTLAGYATTSSLTEGLAAKQDTILDLATIRSGASAGATALQPTDVDGQTVNLNSSDELQAIGVIDNNTGNALKTWTGTRAQYAALANKDPNTLYNITDDTNIAFDILNALYPVGAIYIGTMNVCPLEVLGIGTWKLVSSGRVLQGADSTHTVGTTVEAGLPNIKGTTWSGQYWKDFINDRNGAFISLVENTNQVSVTSQSDSGFYSGAWVYFNAAEYNSIYSDGVNTVQAPAYVVNIWERQAENTQQETEE